jgi:signal peptidase II
MSRRRMALVAFTSFLIDDVSKSVAIKFLGPTPMHLIGNFLALHLSSNAGAAFGIAQRGRGIFIAIAICAIAILVVFSRYVASRNWAFFLGLILGGILGNLSDRLFRSGGMVVDWIELPHWPIFNLADTFMVLGVVGIVYLMIRNTPLRPMDPQGDSRHSHHEGGNE